ncbi:MAG: flippase-like domain-containing protein [Chloroflexi bacterium]|nr:flippase-like domain-containing protein [Chloroflexota bacterium]
MTPWGAPQGRRPPIDQNHSQRPSFSLGRKVLSAPTLISFAVALLLLLFLATRFSVDLDATWENIRRSNLALFLLAAAVHYTTFFFRGARWRLMLRNAGGREQAALPTYVVASRLVLLGWFASSITWFRLGDAYRAFAYYEESGAPLARTMGTILGERVLDIIIVFLLLLAGFLLVYLDPSAQLSPGFLQVGVALVVAALAGLVLMQVFWKRIAHLLPAPIRNRYEGFHQGTMRSFGAFPLVMLLGLLGWLAEVGRLYLVVQATGLEVSIGLIAFVTVANAILSAVPLTPGGLGIVETGIVGLLALAMPREAAVSVALLDRSISYVSVVMTGVLAYLYHRRVVAQRRNGRAAGRPSP